jgi:hypothetical protein
MANSKFVASLQNSAPVSPEGEASACRCVWVSGLPGCGALDVAISLAKALGALLIDLAAIMHCGTDVFIGDNNAAISTVLQALKDAGAQKTAVVCDILSCPAHVISGLASNPRLHVTHVVSVLEPSIVYPWGSARHPLLLSRAHRGWISAAVVQDYRHAGGAPMREWNRLMKLCFNELKACRGSAASMQKPLTSSIVNGPLREPSVDVALRSISLPGLFQEAGTQGAWSTTLPQHTLVGICMASAAPYDLVALRESCLACLQLAAQEACPLAAAASSPLWNGLFCIEAHVRGEDAKALWAQSSEKLRATFQTGYIMPSHRFVLTTRGDMAIPSSLSPPLAESLGLIWWWCIPKPADECSKIALQLRAEVQRSVEACRLQPPPPATLWTLEDLPPEQFASLEAEARAGGVPEGSFSDGVNYIDVDGKKFKEHPALAGLLDAAVARHNAEAQSRNAVIREIAALPLFSTV